MLLFSSKTLTFLLFLLCSSRGRSRTVQSLSFLRSPEITGLSLVASAVVFGRLEHSPAHRGEWGGGLCQSSTAPTLFRIVLTAAVLLTSRSSRRLPAQCGLCLHDPTSDSAELPEAGEKKLTTS